MYDNYILNSSREKLAGLGDYIRQNKDALSSAALYGLLGAGTGLAGTYMFSSDDNPATASDYLKNALATGTGAAAGRLLTYKMDDIARAFNGPSSNFSKGPKPHSGNNNYSSLDKYRDVAYDLVTPAGTSTREQWKRIAEELADKGSLRSPVSSSSDAGTSTRERWAKDIRKLFSVDDSSPLSNTPLNAIKNDLESVAKTAPEQKISNPPVPIARIGKKDRKIEKLLAKYDTDVFKADHDARHANDPAPIKSVHGFDDLLNVVGDMLEQRGWQRPSSLNI